MVSHFTRTFYVDNDLDTRRVINVLLKNREQFAIIPNQEVEGARISIAETGIGILREAGFVE